MKLLATDYDGTLKYGEKIMPEDLSWIQTWKEQGNQFVIVTGRSLASIQKQIDEFNLPVDYIVTNNGGMVFSPDGTELMANYLDTVVAVDILYALKEMDNVASYVVNDGVNRHRIIVNKEVSEHRYLDLDEDLSEEKVLELGKYAQIVISMSSQMSALEMADQINHFFGAFVTAYPNNFVVDVVPKNVSKGNGMDFVLTYSEVADEDVYAIGDSYNDIPMLEQVENAYAIACAPEEVQQAAKQMVSSIGELIENNI